MKKLNSIAIYQFLSYISVIVTVVFIFASPTALGAHFLLEGILMTLLFSAAFVIFTMSQYLKEIQDIKPIEEFRENDMYEPIRRLFHYSFDPIDWKYENLTKLEKDAISPEDFEILKKMFND